jgi:hypothetical protein
MRRRCCGDALAGSRNAQHGFLEKPPLTRRRLEPPQFVHEPSFEARFVMFTARLYAYRSACRRRSGGIAAQTRPSRVLEHYVHFR